MVCRRRRVRMALLCLFLAAVLLVTVAWSWVEASEGVPKGLLAADLQLSKQDTTVAEGAANAVRSPEKVGKHQDEPPGPPPDQPPGPPPDQPPGPPPDHPPGPPPDQPPGPPPDRPPRERPHRRPHAAGCSSAALPVLFVGVSSVWAKSRKR